MVVVTLRGEGPVGQQATRQSTTAALTRIVRRRYQFTVATEMTAISEEFEVVALGQIRYRLVTIDVRPGLQDVMLTIQTRVAAGGRVSPLRVNSTFTSNMPLLVRDVVQGTCSSQRFVCQPLIMLISCFNFPTKAFLGFVISFTRCDSLSILALLMASWL